MSTIMLNHYENVYVYWKLHLRVVYVAKYGRSIEHLQKIANNNKDRFYLEIHIVTKPTFLTILADMIMYYL